MFKPIKELNFIAIALLYIDYEEMKERIKNLLTKSESAWVIEGPWDVIEGPLNIDEVIRNGQTMSGAVNRRIVIWPLGKSKTIFLSNLTDVNAGIIYPLKLTQDSIRIRVSKTNSISDQPMNEFKYVKNGKERLVHAYWDSTRWIFYEKGQLLPFENPDYYKRRKIRDRVNFAIVNEYLEANGWDLNEESFWQSDVATYFLEKHPTKRNE